MLKTYYYQTMGVPVDLGMDIPFPKLLINFFNEDGNPEESVSPFVSEEEHLYANSMRFILATLNDIMKVVSLSIINLIDSVEKFSPFF